VDVPCSRARHPGLLARAASLAAVFLVLASHVSSAQAPATARDIVDHVDRLLRGESSVGRLVMEIETANWSRHLELEVWSRGRKHALIRVLSPRSEAGTATLMVEEQVWNYLPRADRTIKIPPSLMVGSWMGSHFTNDDLVKESQLIDDYDIEIAFEGDRDGVEVWEFELIPKPEVAVVWSRLEYQVRKGDMMPTWARYYDEDGAVARSLQFSDFEVMGGRLVPSVMQILPADKPEESTVVRYESIEFDIGLSTDFFSLRNLRTAP